MVYNLRHVKATKWHYKACMLSKHGVPKPTKNKGILWHNKHKNQLRHGQQEPKLGAPSRGKNGPFQGQQGEGVALSFLGPQGTILTSEIPQDFSGEEAQTPKSRSSHKIVQNKGQTRLKRGQTTPKLEATLTNYLEALKTELLHSICKAKK